jgi:hypothetical protein
MMAGEMNFAPTMMAQPTVDEAFEGGGRNEFRPYIVDGNPFR